MTHLPDHFPPFLFKPVGTVQRCSHGLMGKEEGQAVSHNKPFPGRNDQVSLKGHEAR